MKIISTAGHIDHGKTSLIAAISGFWGDSTPQERERGITIDLSFSDYEGISFVDVPGHEQLLKTMLRGCLSEYALLVIDINEGIMPQTCEHIFALQIMGASHIILALNKCDLCEDIEQRREEILRELSALGCVPSAVFCVSAKTNLGIEALKEHLLNLAPIKRADGPLRLYIDRIFKIPGTGDVATGLLASGNLETGTFYALKEQIKIKSIQAQHKEITRLSAPARAAFSFRGELGLDSIISTKGALKASKQLHASLLQAPNSSTPCENGARMFFASFNQQAPCRVYAVGEFVRIEFERAVVCNFDDPYVLLANGRCVAGGRVLCPVIEPLKKSKMQDLLSALARKDFASAFKMLNAAHGSGFGLFCAQQRFGMSTERALEIANEHCELINESGANCYSVGFKERLKSQITALYEKNHFAMQSAVSLSKSFATDSFLCEQVLGELEFLTPKNGLYVRKDVDFSKIQQTAENRLYEAINKINPQAPYNIYDELNLDRKSGDDILKRLCAKNLAVRLAHNYFISAKALEAAAKQISAMPGGVGVQELKSALNLSRKYAILLLEYLDNCPGVKTIENKRYFGQNFQFILRR